MAKGNLILGTASGKLGDTVMYRKDGQQLSRVRVRKIGNPKTEAQAVNRALLNTLSTAYAYMKGIVDHSYQGLVKPVENQRKFAKLNQGIARETGSVAVPGTDTGYNFNFKGESLLRPNRYAISRGTMPSVEVFNIAAAGGLIAGFQLNQALTALLDTTTTYAQFAAAIGVPVGTQLTFCIISDDTFTGTPSEANMPKSYGNFHFARIILSDDAGNGNVPMFASEGGDIVINTNYANSKNSGALKFKRLGETSLRIDVENQSYPLAMGVIVSNYSSRMWLRSNTDMVVAEGYEDSNTMSEVYMSYMQAETTPISTLYLNQGEGTTTIIDVPTSVTFAAIANGEVIGIGDGYEPFTLDAESDYYFVTPVPIRDISPVGGVTIKNQALCNSPKESADYLIEIGCSDASAYEAVTTALEGRQYCYKFTTGTAAEVSIRLQNGFVLTFATA